MLLTVLAQDNNRSLLSLGANVLRSAQRDIARFARIFCLTLNNFSCPVASANPIALISTIL
jgi:hypothetical protein